jgi:hypothetical protein
MEASVPVVGGHEETVHVKKGEAERVSVLEKDKAPVPVEESKEGRNLSLVAPGVYDLRPDPLVSSLCQVIMITKERNKLRTLFTLIKKEYKIFLIYKEIHMGSSAMSYMRKGFLMNEEMLKYLIIYDEAVCQI